MRELLAGGTRRSLGRSGEAVALVREDPSQFRKLIECLWDEDPVVRMRAADAAEKASLGNASLLQPHKKELLGLLAEAQQQELRWHLALMVPRLHLEPAERQRAVESLQIYLDDTRSIVKTMAMQGLADLARQDDSLLPSIVEQIALHARNGTPAMRARGSRLMRELRLYRHHPASASI